MKNQNRTLLILLVLMSLISQTFSYIDGCYQDSRAALNHCIAYDDCKCDNACKVALTCTGSCNGCEWCWPPCTGCQGCSNCKRCYYITCDNEVCNPQPPEPSCSLENRCRAGDELWKYEAGDGCAGWLYLVKDCDDYDSTGTCGNWKCDETTNNATSKSRFREVKNGRCVSNDCKVDTTSQLCTKYSCPYGCLSGNCIPNAVIAIEPKLAEYLPNQEVQFSCLDSIEPECGNSTASNPSSCKFDLCSACSCSWTIKDASGAQIGSSNSKQFTFNGFTKSGTYTVELSACDDAGACGKTTMLVNVKNSPPTACFNVSPSEGIVGKTEFTFDASCSSDPEGFIIGYDWNFGDGKSDTGVKTKHVYTSSVAGTQAFEVKLVVTDNNNASAEAKKTVTVINNAPVSKFSAVPLSGLSPLTVVFVAKATDPDGHKIVAYEWDFDGDGVVDYTAGPEYIYKYSSPGTYNAKLRVQDEYGAWSLMFDLNISVYELTAIKTLTASNTAVGGSTSIYVECALPSGRNREAELQISSSDGKFSTKTTVPCDQYYLYGPLKSEGVYTITASISGCSAPECLKSTTFHVFEEMPEVVQTPEISFLLVVAVAFIALGIAKFAGNKKPQ